MSGVGALFDLFGRVANAGVDGLAAKKDVKKGCGKCKKKKKTPSGSQRKPARRMRRSRRG